MERVMLDFCHVRYGLVRDPIPEAEGRRFRSKHAYGQELSLDSTITDGDVSCTLRSFCESCESVPFKIIVVRDHGYALVRDDVEWLYTEGCERLDQHLSEHLSA